MTSMNGCLAMRTTSFTFMIVSGMGAGEEVCLVVENGLVGFEGGRS